MGSNPTLAAMLAGASRLFCFCEQQQYGLNQAPSHSNWKGLGKNQKIQAAYTILSSREGISAVNPYALYDYLLANNWSVKRKSMRTLVLETTNGSAEIKVSIDLALADYESRMAEALSELCSCEGIPFSNAIARIAAWRPVKQ